MKKIIDTLLEKALVLLFLIMLFSVIWQVFSRFLLQSPSTITDEISSFSLIWLGLLGAAYATGKRLHLAIDLIPSRIIAKKQLFYDGIIQIAVFVFGFLVMVIGGARLCWLTFVFEQKSATLEIPLGIIYLVIPLSGLLVCYYSLEILLQKRALKK
ncbi:TRAP transporter small permease [uncultured Aquimarina sp.]|uniref:TRAP transporter small permease n=1 Tax=uncultured Aquimarina sp. TaxID=575652 RepID=UPI00262509C5|nr:TRAP transporter small permease [uncultured Aquimarina sp.]